MKKEPKDAEQYVGMDYESIISNPELTADEYKVSIIMNIVRNFI